MCEAPFEVPEGFVPAHEQAHAQGLLMIHEAAKLLDMRIPDLAMEAGAGRIEITARCNNLPCFSLQTVDAYRRQRRTARAS
jgi:proline racemase